MLGPTFLLVAAVVNAFQAAAVEPPEWIAEAIAWGANQERVEMPSAKGPGLVRCSTPFLRVAVAAQEAKREGRALDPASMPVSLTASELHVFAPLVPAQALPGGRMVMGVATEMTLMVAGERLKPSSVEALTLPMSVAALGGPTRHFEGRELKAVFPLNQPPAEVQVLVLYSWVNDGKPGQMERKYKLDLRKTRW